MDEVKLGHDWEQYKLGDVTCHAITREEVENVIL